MAPYEDKIRDHEVDGIQEYDNPMPGWLLGILGAAVVFSVLYIAFYALAFAPTSMASEYLQEAVEDREQLQKYYDANPIVPPKAEEILAAVLDPNIVEAGRGRFVKTCAACHGEIGQGLIGPNLADDSWLHGGAVTQIYTTVVKGIPAKGMPPWGRAIAPDELLALVAYIRSIQGSKPADPKPAEGVAFTPEPLPGR